VLEDSNQEAVGIPAGNLTMVSKLRVILIKEKTIINQVWRLKFSIAVAK